MKTLIRHTSRILLLSVVLILGACTKESPEYTGSVEYHLLYPDGTTGYKVEIEDNGEFTLILKSTKKHKKDQVLELDVKGLNHYTLTPKTITLPAGQISVSTKFAITTNEIVTETETVTLSIANLKQGDKLESPALLIIAPKYTYKLSDRDKALLLAWKSKLGINLRPLLGDLVCEGTVTEPGGGSPELRFGQPRTLEIKDQVTTLVISRHATEERPVLEMTKNALGLESYYKDLYLHKTILDTEFWNEGSEYAPPSPKLIMKRLNWTKETPITLNLSLVNMTVDPQNKTSLLFIGVPAEAITGEYRPDPKDSKILNLLEETYPAEIIDESVKYNLFHFDLSVWDELVKLSKTDKEIRDACHNGNVSPYQIFCTTRIDTDGWKNNADITHYVAPKATIDYDKQTIHFRTVMDQGDAAAYTVINITCKKK